MVMRVLVIMRLAIVRIRYRIITTFMKRVTTQHPAYAHPDTLEWPPFFHRLYGVGRTAGHITTVITQQGADQQLIDPDEFYQERFHVQANSTLSHLSDGGETDGIHKNVARN